MHLSSNLLNLIACRDWMGAWNCNFILSCSKAHLKCSEQRTFRAQHLLQICDQGRVGVHLQRSLRKGLILQPGFRDMQIKRDEIKTSEVKPWFLDLLHVSDWDSGSRLKSVGSLAKRLKTGVNSKQFSNKENLTGSQTKSNKVKHSCEHSFLNVLVSLSVVFLHSACQRHKAPSVHGS